MPALSRPGAAPTGATGRHRICLKDAGETSPAQQHPWEKDRKRQQLGSATSSAAEPFTASSREGDAARASHQVACARFEFGLNS
jgi:hypothetical protein